MANHHLVLLDGGMGTMLQAAGLPLGELPESWNLTHPDIVTGIHRQYVEAGAHVIFANTFGANRIKIARFGFTVGELVTAGIRCARAAADEGVQVALDVGPIGQLMAPLGSLSFDEAYDIYRELLVAGERAGADRIIFETMSDLQELRAGILAAKENTSLPVWATMTFEASGRTFLGVTVPAMALTLSGLGVEALGFNCSLGPGELIPLVRELRSWTDLPLILKPNAGLPDPATGKYFLSARDFAAQLREALSLGVQYIGGCCGTDPAFIRELAPLLTEALPGPSFRSVLRLRCCGSRSCPDHRRTDQSHRKKKNAAGSPGPGSGLYCLLRSGAAGSRRRYSGCQCRTPRGG